MSKYQSWLYTSSDKRPSPSEKRIEEWVELWEEFDFTPSEPVSKEDALRIIKAYIVDLNLLYEDIDKSRVYDPWDAYEAYGDSLVDFAREEMME